MIQGLAASVGSRRLPWRPRWSHSSAAKSCPPSSRPNPACNASSPTPKPAAPSPKSSSA
jgi:hypothetical protein